MPFVSHGCACTWQQYYQFRIEKYRQRVARQKQTLVAPCGSRQCLASFVNGLTLPVLANDTFGAMDTSGGKTREITKITFWI